MSGEFPPESGTPTLQLKIDGILAGQMVMTKLLARLHHSRWWIGLSQAYERSLRHQPVEGETMDMLDKIHDEANAVAKGVIDQFCGSLSPNQCINHYVELKCELMAAMVRVIDYHRQLEGEDYPLFQLCSERS